MACPHGQDYPLNCSKCHPPRDDDGQPWKGMYESAEREVQALRPVVEAVRSMFKEMDDSVGAATLGPGLERWTLPSKMIDLREALEKLDG